MYKPLAETALPMGFLVLYVERFFGRPPRAFRGSFRLVTDLYTPFVLRLRSPLLKHFDSRVDVLGWFLRPRLWVICVKCGDLFAL